MKQSWAKKLLYAAAGLLALVAFHILGGPERKVKKLKGQRDELVLQGSKRSKELAEKKGKQADKAQANAVLADKAGKKAVENIGKNNESMRDILDAFHSDSV